MTYDFTIHAPGTVRDAQHALEVALQLEDVSGRSCTPGGPMDRFLHDLEGPGGGEDGFIEWPPSATDDVAILTTSRADVPGNIRTITEAAAAHGLAVFDLQYSRLLDLADALPVTVTTDGGPDLTWASAGVIRTVLDEIEAGRYPWLVLERRGGAYAQTYLRDGGTWDVEYRDGGPETHQLATTTDRTEVETFLVAWLRDDHPAWRESFTFQHPEL